MFYNPANGRTDQRTNPLVLPYFESAKGELLVGQLTLQVPASLTKVFGVETPLGIDYPFCCMMSSIESKTRVLPYLVAVSGSGP